MAHRIKGISLYRPRIEQGNTVQKPELIRLVSRATGLVEATLDYGIKELRDQIIEITRSGRAVKIEGLGTWSPNNRNGWEFRPPIPRRHNPGQRFERSGHLYRHRPQP